MNTVEYDASKRLGNNGQSEMDILKAACNAKIRHDYRANYYSKTPCFPDAIRHITGQSELAAILGLCPVCNKRHG